MVVNEKVRKEFLFRIKADHVEEAAIRTSFSYDSVKKTLSLAGAASSGEIEDQFFIRAE